MFRRRYLCIHIISLATCLGWSGVASAHEAGLSRGRYTLAAASVKTEVSLALRDARALALQLDRDRDGTLSHQELADGAQELSRRLTHEIRWTLGERPCVPRAISIEPAGDDGLTHHATYVCPGDLDESLTLDLEGLLTAAYAGHRHIFEVTYADGTNQTFAGHRVAFVFRPLEGWTPRSVPTTPAKVADNPPAKTPAPSMVYIHEGIHHVLFGWDHLLFLCGLVLVYRRSHARSIRPKAHHAAQLHAHTKYRLLVWVSGFTVGHCLSLMGATLLGMRASALWVEPLIAVSLAHLGWLAWKSDSKPGTSLAWLLVGFGLVHGLGFAGALASLQISGFEGLWPLLLFNAGVEVGQLIVLAAVLVVTMVLRWLAPARRTALLRGSGGCLLLTGLATALIRLVVEGLGR